MLFSASLPDLRTACPHELTPAQASPNQWHRACSFSESDIASIEAGLLAQDVLAEPPLSGQQMAGLLQQALLGLDAEYAEAMQILSPPQQELVLTMQTLTEQGPAAAQAQSRPGTPAHTLARQAWAYLDERGHAGATTHERTLGVLDFLGKLINNRFDSDLGRSAANLVNVGVRTGLIVALTTTLRQIIGFELEKALQLGEASVEARELIGLSAMLLGAGLNLAGAVRDECNGTASARSRVARTTMAALSVGTLLLVSQVGTPSVLGTSASSVGVQMAAYTLSRDVLQLFFPLHDNSGINLGGTLIGGASYSVLQFLSGEAMNRWAPHSGAGWVMTSAAAGAENLTQWFAGQLDDAPETPSTASLPAYIVGRVNSAIGALMPDLRQDALRGGINAMVEVADDLVRGAVSRSIQVHQLKQATWGQALRHGENPASAVAALPREATEGLRIRLGARIPGAGQIADQLLTVTAMRTSAFEIIVGMGLSAATALQGTRLSAGSQAHAVNAVVALAATLIYPPLIYAGAQSPRPAASVSTQVEMQLRRRHAGGSASRP
jgi:hypothetical protein